MFELANSPKLISRKIWMTENTGISTLCTVKSNLAVLIFKTCHYDISRASETVNSDTFWDSKITKLDLTNFLCLNLFLPWMETTFLLVSNYFPHFFGSQIRVHKSFWACSYFFRHISNFSDFWQKWLAHFAYLPAWCFLHSCWSWQSICSGFKVI